MTELIVCSNIEWVRDYFDLNDNDVTEQAICDIVKSLEDSGFIVNLSWGQNSTFHGWNGNQILNKIGPIASYVILSDKEEGIIFDIIENLIELETESTH